MGGDGDKTYEGDGYAFTYPGDWEGGNSASITGNDRDALVGPPGRGGLEYVAVLVNEGRPSVTDDNIVEAIADLAEELAQDGGLLDGPEQIEVGGLPAAQANFRATNDEGVEIRSRQTYVYQGTTWYLIICNAPPAQFDDHSVGCDRVESSLRFDG